MFDSLKNINKEKFQSLLAAGLLTAILFAGVHFLGNHFATVMGIILGILLVVLLSILMVMAGFMVLKCLFVFAAELSLLIFLGQSYCDVSNPTAAGNAALEGLIIVGLLYIAIEFLRSLYNALKEQYKKIGNEKAKENKFGIAPLISRTTPTKTGTLSHNFRGPKQNPRPTPHEEFEAPSLEFCSRSPTQNSRPTMPHH